MYDLQCHTGNIPNMSSKEVRDINLPTEKRFSKYTTINAKSVKTLNKLEENDLLNNNLPKKDCQAGFYIDRALVLLAEKEGIIF